MAGITYTNVNGSPFTVTIGGLDNTKTYTVCVTGIRGGTTTPDYYRWTQYTLGGMQAGYTSLSSDGSGSDDRDKVIISGANVTFLAGMNYTNGYVAKWGNVQPTDNPHRNCNRCSGYDQQGQTQLTKDTFPPKNKLEEAPASSSSSSATAGAAHRQPVL